MDRKQYETKVNELTIEMLQEEVSQEQRLARMEARQIIYFGNGSEGICAQRGKAIDALGKAITSIKMKVAMAAGGVSVILVLLSVFRSQISKVLFG